MAQNYREYYIEKDCREVAMLNISKPIRAMPILKSKKQGHHAGAWFTTDGAPDLDPIGVHDLGSLVLWAIVACLVSVAAYVFRFWRTSDTWGKYSGLVYCQVYGDDLRFYKTLRGGSRALLKPPAVTRSFASLTKFRSYTTGRGKLFFGFSDGLEIDLYFVDGDSTNFYETVNLLLEQHRKSV